MKIYTGTKDKHAAVVYMQEPGGEKRLFAEGIVLDWGYHGAAPAALARYLLWDHLGFEPRPALYFRFAVDHIEHLQPNWVFSSEAINAWLDFRAAVGQRPGDLLPNPNKKNTVTETCGRCGWVSQQIHVEIDCIRHLIDENWKLRLKAAVLRQALRAVCRSVRETTATALDATNGKAVASAVPKQTLPTPAAARDEVLDQSLETVRCQVDCD